MSWPDITDLAYSPGDTGGVSAMVVRGTREEGIVTPS